MKIEFGFFCLAIALGFLLGFIFGQKQNQNDIVADCRQLAAFRIQWAGNKPLKFNCVEVLPSKIKEE